MNESKKEIPEIRLNYVNNQIETYEGFRMQTCYIKGVGIISALYGSVFVIGEKINQYEKFTSELFLNAITSEDMINVAILTTLLYGAGAGFSKIAKIRPTLSKLYKEQENLEQKLK